MRMMEDVCIERQGRNGEEGFAVTWTIYSTMRQLGSNLLSRNQDDPAAMILKYSDHLD